MATSGDCLSRAAKNLYRVGIPVVFCGLLVLSPRTAVGLPFIALPTLWLLWQRAKLLPQRQPDLETLIWTYFLSGTLGVAVVATVQSVVGYALAVTLFGDGVDEYLEEFGRTSLDNVSADDMQRRARMASTWQHLLILLVLAFVLAGLLEEAMKYCAVSYIKHRRGTLQATEYIAYAIASAIGFATIENIGFVCASAEVDSIRMTALTLAERIVIAMPGHALMGVLTAVKMVQRDLYRKQLNIWKVLYPSVLYHGCFDFAMFGMSALDGNVGWIHPREPSRILLLLVIASSMLMTLVWHVKSALSKTNLD